MPHDKKNKADTPYETHQAEQKHPEPYDRDLNPNRLEGQNIGARTALDDPHGHRASELKELVTKLQEFDRDELDKIPVLTKGARLKQGATYLDLSDPNRRPFTAMGHETVEIGSFMVPKHDCPAPFWNRLRGMKDPQRTT